jgi:hypothetical protein
MLIILLAFGWGIAVILLVVLVTHAIRHRVIPRRGQRSVEDEMEWHGPAHAESRSSRRVRLVVGLIALAFWEGFWVSEISDRFQWSANPFQLPYFFLFVVMIGIPFVVYLIARRLKRETVQSP